MDVKLLARIAIKLSFVFCVLLILNVNASTTNWTNYFTSEESKTSAIKYKITAEELDGMIYAYADSYMTQIFSATREITTKTKNSQQRRDAMLLRVSSVNSIYDIASNPDPYTKLLDLLLVVTLQSYIWIDEDKADKHFGSTSTALINALYQNRLDIWKLAAKVMKPEQLYTLDWLIIDWRRQNPDVNFISYTRFSDVAASRGKSLVADVETGAGFLAPVNEAKKALEETRLLAERSFFYAKRAPQLYSWQAENLTNNLLAKPEIERLLNGINRSTFAIERISKVMEKLPQLMQDEQKFISDELDKRESSLSKLLAELRHTIKDTEHLVITVDKLSGSGNLLLTELRTTSDSLNNTLKTFDKMMTNHFPQPAGQKEENAKPFDINEYTKALVGIDKAAVELTTLVGASGNMIYSDSMTQRIEQLNNTARERVEHATQQSEKMLQSLFIYAALILTFTFLLFILYNLLTKKIVKQIGTE